MSRKRPKILIADDNEDIKNMLAVELRDFFDVTFAVDGLEAVSKFREAREDNEPFAVVVLDLALPGLDGFRVLDDMHLIELRDTTLPTAKFALMTGYTEMVESSSLLDETKTKFQLYVRKPEGLAHVAKDLADLIGLDL